MVERDAAHCELCASCRHQGTSTSRDTLKSFLIAGELNRAGQFDHIGAMISCIDYGPAGADLFQGQKGGAGGIAVQHPRSMHPARLDVPAASSEGRSRSRCARREATWSFSWTSLTMRAGSGGS